MDNVSPAGLFQPAITDAVMDEVRYPVRVLGARSPDMAILEEGPGGGGGQHARGVTGAVRRARPLRYGRGGRWAKPWSAAPSGDVSPGIEAVDHHRCVSTCWAVGASSSPGLWFPGFH
jgi:hypothetical protein